MGYGKGTKGGRPIGTSKYPYRDDQEEEIVVQLIKKGTTNDDIAAMLGWSAIEVRDTRAKFFPTVGLAQDILKAGARKLVERVLEEANVEESIDILSRPNIGVLEPSVKATSQPKIGIFTNIQTSTLGGVVASSIIDLSPDHDPNPVPVPRAIEGVNAPCLDQENLARQVVDQEPAPVPVPRPRLVAKRAAHPRKPARPTTRPQKVRQPPFSKRSRP